MGDERKKKNQDKIKDKKRIDMPKCPKCCSRNTVGMVNFGSIDKTSNMKKGYFCSQCLIEFDDSVIRCYSFNGSWIKNVAIEG